MSVEQPVWCHKCHLRIAPYDLQTVFRSRAYHRNCLLRLVHQQAQESQPRRALQMEKRKQPLVRSIRKDKSARIKAENTPVD